MYVCIYYIYIHYLWGFPENGGNPSHHPHSKGVLPLLESTFCIGGVSPLLGGTGNHRPRLKRLAWDRPSSLDGCHGKFYLFSWMITGATPMMSPGHLGIFLVRDTTISVKFSLRPLKHRGFSSEFLHFLIRVFRIRLQDLFFGWEIDMN